MVPAVSLHYTQVPTLEAAEAAMIYGATAETTKQTSRAQVLGAELRLLRIRSDLLGSSGAVHALRNDIATAQGALGLIDKYREHGRQSDADALLELAETRLRDARRLMAGANRSRRLRHL